MATVVSIRACPKCGSEARVPIVYGCVDEELAEEARLGGVVLGGFVVDDYPPRWLCRQCRNKWGRFGPFNWAAKPVLSRLPSSAEPATCEVIESPLQERAIRRGTDARRN